MKTVSICFLIVPLALGVASAQESAPVPEGAKVMVLSGVRVSSGGESGVSNFAYHEVRRGGEFVKGAPYTATAITETTQVLADGNRITNKSTALLARDSEGRTRREETMSNLGPLPLEGPRMVFLTDPEANTEYVLNPMEKTADVLKSEKRRMLTVEQKDAVGAKVKAERFVQAKELGEIKREPLGTQIVEGLTCEGQLETQTIPAGSIGNERPMVITSETWASPELHLLVTRKRNDPRFGETVYKLTEIKRGEPDPSLFQVPSTFKVLDMPPLRSPME